jgi:CheY-like chemotaxis protein
MSQRDHSLAAETRLVSAMHYCHRQCAQSFHGRNVIFDAAVGQHVEQRTIINRVTGKQDAAARFPKPDTPRGMAGQMQDLERAIAEIYYVAFVELSNPALDEKTDLRPSKGRRRLQRLDSPFAANALSTREVALSSSHFGTGAWYPFASRIPSDQRIASCSRILAKGTDVARSEYPRSPLNSGFLLTASAIGKNENSTASRGSNRNVGVANIETDVMHGSIMVAVVDDDRPFREVLVFQLVAAGFQVAAYPSAEGFLDSFRSGECDYDCIVADICLPGLSGLQLFGEVKKSVPFASIIFVSSSGDLSVGVQAMREGAFDCVEKPIDQQLLLSSIPRATIYFAGGARKISIDWNYKSAKAL